LRRWLIVIGSVSAIAASVTFSFDLTIAV
jgi:hypothetical protein